MSRYHTITDVADSVLASVRRDMEEARSKTASAAQPVPVLDTAPTALAMRKLAAAIRDGGAPDEPMTGGDVSSADLEMLLQDPEVAALLEEINRNPELLAAILHSEGAQGAEDAMPAAPPTEKAAHVSSFSGELKKFAQVLRKTDAVSQKRKLIKAASALNAATGLQHLNQWLRGRAL